MSAAQPARSLHIEELTTITRRMLVALGEDPSARASPTLRGAWPNRSLT